MRAPPIRRMAPGARRPPPARPSVPRAPRRASPGRGRARARARSGRALRCRRPRPTKARGRAHVRAVRRRRPRAGASAAPDRRNGRAGSGTRRDGPRARACRAARAKNGPVRPRSAAHEGRRAAGVAARMIVRSICRARLAWISWPATARRSAWATVPVRIGLRPRTLRSVSASSGSSAKRRRNSE